MKKLLVLLIALAMALSFAACGGEDAPADVNPASSNESMPDSNDFTEFTGNGLSFSLPTDFEYVNTDDFGSMQFSNEERTQVVTVGTKGEEQITSTDFTDEDLRTVLEGEGALSNVTLESSEMVEQDGGTSLIAFGKGTLDGTRMISAIQIFFAEDGGYYPISYLYTADAGTSLEKNDNITLVMSSIKRIKE